MQRAGRLVASSLIGGGIPVLALTGCSAPSTAASL